MGAVVDIDILGLDAQLGVGGHVIGIGNTGEFLDLAFARQFVETLTVALFAFLDRGGDMHFDEGTELLDVLAHGAAGGGIGRDGRTDGDAAVLGDFRRDIADAADVQIAVLFGETQFRRQVLTNDITIQQRHGTAAHFHQLHHQSIGDGGFSRTGEAGEEDGKALFGARRFGAAQFLHHFGEGEPFRDIQTFGQTTAQFGARDIEDLRAFLDLVGRLILRAILDPNHMFEVDHFDAHFLLMLAEQVLRIIGAVEIFARRVGAGSGVVAANDEMGAAIVGADQTVPHGLARASHTHRQRQERHRGGRGRIFIQNRLIAAHAGEVIHIAGFGHAHHRMDEQVGLGFFRGAEGQFLVRAVQRVAGLEGHNAAPAQLAEIGAQFVGRVAAGAEIVMHGLLDAGNRTAEVDLAGVVVQVVHRRMGIIVRAEHFFGLAGFVGHPIVGDGHGCKDHALLVAQRDVLPRFERSGEVLAHVQSDRHRPQAAIGKAHVLDDAVVILLGQKALERVEAAIHQQFEIANLTRCQIPADQIGRFDFQLLSALI